MKKFKMVLYFTIVFLIINTFNAFALADLELSDDTVKYYAIVMGTSEDEIVNMYNSNTTEQFEQIIEDMLRSRKWTDDMYNSENEFNISSVALDKSPAECSSLFNLDLQTINKHIQICGNSLYNKFIKSFESSNAHGIMTLDSSGGSGNNAEPISPVLWRKMCDKAHTGNIFITKDNASLDYNHGHVGVVQNHTSSPKYITEGRSASGNAVNQIICDKLYDPVNYMNPIGCKWVNYSTLCVVYPNTATTEDRVRAGNQTWYYAESDHYTYEFYNTKSNARNTNYRKLNCVGVAVRAYYFMASYDIVPQKPSHYILLPSYVYYSPNIRFKYDNDGNILRTDNFESVDWGFQ